MILADGTVYPHQGKILYTDRQVDITTGSIRIASSFPNPENILRPGQFGRIRAATEQVNGALLVPQRAVNELQGTYQVAVVGEGNKVSIRSVKVGDRVGENWIIQDGVKPGEMVIVEGLQKVRDGSVVKPKEQAAGSGAGAARSYGKGRLIMSKFFINRPIVAMVIAIVMVIVGAVTITALPVALFPNIVPPEVQVQATYVGADAQTIEQSVATPIEQQMSGVDNMNYMYSLNSTADGGMRLIVDFDVKTDPNTDLILTQMRQTQAQSQLAGGREQFRHHGAENGDGAVDAADVVFAERDV